MLQCKTLAKLKMKGMEFQVLCSEISSDEISYIVLVGGWLQGVGCGV